MEPSAPRSQSTAMSIEGEYGGELVFLQATPFCNIDCDYCYLQGRDDKNRMSLETLRLTLERVREFGSTNGTYCLVWHVGEPLVVPIDWYRQAHQLCSELLADKPLELHFQTNGTLITPAWVEFIKSNPRIQVGISLDGPARIHDAHRRSRNGSPTHARVMKGVGLLKEAGIPFNCIAVVTEEALDCPDELYEFFAGLGPRMVSLNAENVDGANLTSSLGGADREVRYRRFLRRIADLHLSTGKFLIRNFLWAQLRVKAIAEGTWREDPVDGNRLNQPWRILSVDWQGRFHTYSPSLLGMEVPHVGKWLGNVQTDSIRSVMCSGKFAQLQAEIDLGIEKCRRECRYFDRCGGGSPAHKFFEHRSFAVSESAECRLGVQADWDAYLAAAEEFVLR